MKSKHYLMIGLFSSAVLCSGQIVMNQANFPRQVNFTDSVVSAGNLTLPILSHGTNQTWDLSSVVNGNLSTTEYLDASANTNFPGALSYAEGQLSFNGLLMDSDEYQTWNASGWTYVGRTIGDITYNVAALSGGPNDSLRFVGGNYVYPGSYTPLPFPTSYADKWTLNYEQDLDFELTVAGFNLNKTPGTNTRYWNEEREVVGEGTVVLPDGNGNASDPIDIILIKSVRTWIDSTFLGGAPAPAPLMAAFGLTQGAVVLDSFYVAYSPGFGAPVLSATINGNQLISLGYRPAVFNKTVSTNDEVIASNQFRFSPNPVKPGSFVQIQTSLSSAAHQISIINLNGQKMFEQRLESTNNEMTIQIPSHLSTGTYLLHISDSSGRLLFTDKMQVTNK